MTIVSKDDNSHMPKLNTNMPTFNSNIPTFDSNMPTFNENEMASTLLQTSKQTVKWLLIRDVLIKEENVHISQENINNYINEQIKKNNQYTKEIKKYYNDDNNRNKLYEDMVNQKLYESLESYFINHFKESSTLKLRKNNKG